MNDDDPFTDQVNFRKDMGGEQDGALAPQFFDKFLGLNDLERIDSNRWFIKYQDFRVMDDRLCQADSLPETF